MIFIDSDTTLNIQANILDSVGAESPADFLTFALQFDANLVTIQDVVVTYTILGSADYNSDFTLTIKYC